MPGGSSKQTVGYKYYLGVHMALCHGPIDAVTEIQVDRRVAWEGITEGGRIEVNAPLLFGGDKREGGVSGPVDIEMGGPAQTQNSYLQSLLGADIPAFRGVACAVLNQCYMGNNPYLKPWAFEVARIATVTYGEAQWYIGKAKVAGTRPSACVETCDSIADVLGTEGADWVYFTSVGSTSSVDFFPADTGTRTVDVSNQPGKFEWVAVGSGSYALPALCNSDSPTHELAMNLTVADSAVFLTDDSYGDTLVEGGMILRSYAADEGAGSGNIVVAQVGGVFTSPLGARTVLFQRYTIGIEERVELGQQQNRLKIVFTAQFGTSPTYYSSWFDTDGTYKEVTYNITSSEVYVTGASLNQLAIDGTVTVCLTHRFEGGEKQEVSLSQSNNVILQTWSSYSNVASDLAPAGSPDIDGLRFFQFGKFRCPIFYTGEALECGILFDAWETFQLDQECPCTDMNPAHIIRECLTDTVWGMGYLSADVDATSFESAADTLHTEGMGMSILWEREQPIEDFVGEVLRHIDGVLYVSRETGKFVLKLIREESPVVTLDESNVSQVMNAKRPTISELTNSVTIVYWDCTTDENASVMRHNEALRSVQGVDISATIQYPGFSNLPLAQRVAERDLRALSTPLLSCEVVANRTAAQLNVGDVFTLDWPDLNISSEAMRVNEIDYGDGVDNSVKIVCVQDVFLTPTTTSHAAPSEVWVDPAATQPADAINRVITEAPYYSLVVDLGEREVDAILTEDSGAGFLLAAAGRAGNEFNASVNVDSGGGYVESNIMDFSPYAYLTADISETATSLTIDGAKDLDQVEIGSIAQIGDELVRVDSLTLTSGVYTGVTVGRGILDTAPRKHLDNSAIVFWGDFAATDDVQYTSGESIDVKLRTTQNIYELALSAATAGAVAFSSRAFRPYPPGDLKVDGLSYPAAIEWVNNHTFTWVHRDRLQQTSASFADHFDAGIGPEAGTTYRVEGFAYNEASPVAETKFIDINVGSATTWTFDDAEVAAEAGVDFPPADTKRIIIRVWAVRGSPSLDSWQCAELEMQNDVVSP